MSEIINYTRLTTSDKLPDKFITCQAYLSQDRDQAERGEIFSHLEILSPWFATNQVGQTIINTLIKEYYRGKDSADLVNFEEAIKKVNESLAQTAQNGETEWIGKLSGVLLLVNKTEIHFAQTGSSNAYLYRAGKVNHITEGLENDEAPHPLKTFSNLTSGSVQDGDKIIVANNTFFEVINPNELKLIISSLPPTLAAVECAKILQNHGTQDANAIFFELTNLERLADLPPDQKLEAVYLDRQIASISSLSRNILSNVSGNIGSLFKKSASNIKNFSKDTVTPLAKMGLDKTKQLTRSKSEEIDQKMEEMSIEKGHHENVGPIKLAISSATTTFLKAKTKLKRFLIQLGIYTRKKSKMYLGMLVSVLVILAVIISFTYNHKKNSQKSEAAGAVYNKMVALAGEADVLFSANPNDAVVKYNEVLSLAESIKGTKYFSQTKTMTEKASQQIESVAKLARIEPKEKLELKSTALALSDKNIFALANNDFYSKNIASGNFNKIASLGVEAGNLVYLSDAKALSTISKNQLISFDSSGNNLKVSGIAFNSPSNLKSFGSSVYIADVSENQLYKIPYSDGKFGQKNSYLKEGVSVADLVDFAIDGSVYTLSKNGTVARLSRGSKINEFNISLPSQEKIDSHVGIATSESATDLLVLAKIKNNYRIIVLRKSGDFLKQYELRDVSEITSFASDHTNTNIYIQSKDKILVFYLS